MTAAKPIALAVALVCAVLPAGAQATFEPGAELVSADYERLEQADDSTSFAAISADGRFVVMQTRARNFFADDDPDPPGRYRAGGVFRYELATKDLEKVADGDHFDEATNEFIRRGASNPAISHDGRFVAFSTTEALLPADTNGRSDVYVRDMELRYDEPGAYELASALDGSEAAADYGPPPAPGSTPGSDLTRGVAISGDGRRVAFRTDAASNLPGGGPTTVPAGQVLVRDLDADTTTLATVTAPGNEPAGGALGAALSGDGSTVTWTGANAPTQTRFLNGEPADNSVYYYLWRRIDDGGAAVTRRITGVSDPDDPACPPEQVTQFDQGSQGPCYGPLTEPEGIPSSIIAQVPAISNDGRTVAYLTGGAPRPLLFTGTALDAFVTDMSPGISRKEGTTELTRGTASNDAERGSPIAGLSMSPNGEHLTITTVRTEFLLDVLAPTGPARTVAGPRDIYAIDLNEMTIDRAALSYTGDDIDSDVGTPSSISNDGRLVAFTSFAGNLFYGDANQRPDAFVSTLAPDDGEEPPPPPPPDPGPDVDDDRLLARATNTGKGRIRLSVQVPASGGLKATIEGKVGKNDEKRKLATKSGRLTEPGTIDLELKLVERYRKELAREKRIRGLARLSFVYSLGGETITDSLRVVFKQKPSGRK